MHFIPRSSIDSFDLFGGDSGSSVFNLSPLKHCFNTLRCTCFFRCKVYAPRSVSSLACEVGTLGLVVFGLSNVGRVGNGNGRHDSATFRGFVHSPSIQQINFQVWFNLALVLGYHHSNQPRIHKICTESNCWSLTVGYFGISRDKCTEAAILGLPVVLLLSLLGFEDRWWSSYLTKIGEVWRS